MSEALSWNRDGADWPWRDHSRFIKQGHLQWHVQRWPAPAPLERESTNPAQPSTPPLRLWLLHGTGASTHTWRDVAPILAQHHEVLSVDLPGHAFTRGAVDEDLTLPGMARALITLQATLSAADGSRDARHIGSPLASGSNTELQPTGTKAAPINCWIGHSAGAAVALQIMQMNRLIAPQAISLNGALLPWGGRAASLFMPLARALATHAWSTRFFLWNARRPGTVKALLRDTGSVIDARGHELYARLAHNEEHLRAVLRMMANWELEPFARELPQLRGQVTLISSAYDGTVPPSVSGRAAALIPGARLMALPRWGHLGHEEAPAEWASLILQSLGLPP